jgi:hypothetical protein
MERWRKIIRLLAQLAMVGLIIKAFRGPVQWRHEPPTRP